MDLELRNLTTNYTNLNYEHTTAYRVVEILNTITSIVSAISNIVIVYVLLKHRATRTRSNIYISNWCICNFFVMLCAPTTLNLFGTAEMLEYEPLCIWEEIFFSFMFGNLMFVMIVLLNWYISTYASQSRSIKCRKSFRFTLIAVWIIILLLLFVSIGICLSDLSFPLNVISLFFGYFAIFVVIIVVFILRFVKRKTSSVVVEKSKTELVLVSSFFLCLLPNWVYVYGHVFFSFWFSFTAEHLMFLVSYSHAWVMMIILYFYDKKFRSCLRKTVGLSHDDLDTDDKGCQNTLLL